MSTKHTILWLLICITSLVAIVTVIIPENLPFYMLGIGGVTMFYAARSILSSLRWGSPAAKREEDAREAFIEAHRMVTARRAVRSLVPKAGPVRDSRAAHEGAYRITSARSLASLVQKEHLRRIAIDICDMGDMILETIRKMPADTPSAVAFCDKSLEAFCDMLERSLKMSRTKEYREAGSTLDRQEMESFAAFIYEFRRQQENILFEGRVARAATAELSRS